MRWLDGLVHRLNRRESEQSLGDGKVRAVWRAAVHGVANSQTQLSDRTITRNPKTQWREMGRRVGAWGGSWRGEAGGVRRHCVQL